MLIKESKGTQPSKYSGQFNSNFFNAWFTIWTFDYYKGFQYILSMNPVEFKLLVWILVFLVTIKTL